MKKLGFIFVCNFVFVGIFGLETFGLSVTGQVLCETKDSCTHRQVLAPKGVDRNFEFSEGLAGVRKDGKFAFINKEARVVLGGSDHGGFFFEAISSFSEGLSNIKLAGVWGFIDKTGKTVIPFEFEDAYGFSGGLARVQKNGKWGLINRQGKMVLPCDFASIYDISDGLVGVKLAAGIHKDKDFVKRYGLDQVEEMEPDWLDHDNNWGFLKLQDEGGARFAILPNFHGDGSVGRFFQQRAWVVSGNRYGYLDLEGKIAIKPRFFDAFRFSENGLARVARIDDQQKIRYGFINKEGRYAIVPSFEYAEDFSEGLAWVETSHSGEKKVGFINEKGQYPNKKLQARFFKAGSFSEGLALVRKEKNGPWSFINKKGEEVLSGLNYDYVGRVKEGMAKIVFTGPQGQLQTGYLQILPKK